MRELLFIIVGYLSGSVLYGRVWSSMMKQGDIFAGSADHNPGTSNAFRYGGFWCGLLTLTCDLMKGYIPVQLYLWSLAPLSFRGLGLAAVLAAPVVGHAFPLFYRFQGGKGIAVTFGCLLGLLPNWLPLGCLVVSFVFFSVILRISPHYYRTIASYAVALAAMLCFRVNLAVCLGFSAITAGVFLKLHQSNEQRESMRVSLLWMH